MIARIWLDHLSRWRKSREDVETLKLLSIWSTPDCLYVNVASICTSYLAFVGKFSSRFQISCVHEVENHFAESDCFIRFKAHCLFSHFVFSEVVTELLINGVRSSNWVFLCLVLNLLAVYSMSKVHSRKMFSPDLPKSEVHYKKEGLLTGTEGSWIVTQHRFTDKNTPVLLSASAQWCPTHRIIKQAMVWRGLLICELSFLHSLAEYHPHIDRGCVWLAAEMTSWSTVLPFLEVLLNLTSPAASCPHFHHPVSR